MKKYTHNEITLLQYIFLIVGTQMGVGFLSLPKVVAEKAGTDGWMGLIIGWILSVAASIIMVKTAEKYPNDTLYDLLIRFFGKILGKVAIFIILGYTLCFSLMIFINTFLYIKAWFLPNTPDYLIVLLFSIPVLFIVRSGLRVIGRYNELIFYMTMWLPVIFLLPLKDGSFLNLLPLFKVGWESISATVPPVIYSFLGFELVFFFYPFLKKKQYAIHGIIIANTLSMFFYLFVTISCFVFFSPDSITGFNQPVLSMLKVIEFRFIERLDVVILNILILFSSRAWILYMYCTVFSFSQLMNKQDHSLYVPVLLGLLVVGTFFVQPTWMQVTIWQKWASNAGIAVAYVFPVFLWIYSWGYEKFSRRRFS
ncbi:GerAB/ArcD/ProY family transporter [Peribacillus sp. NPDC094092]|uniref:GerAB/ArcD/ProY family transporter n=1 Tax=Peribacillus sp. NPDC094092 TaxID=3390611 RepID=UPI003D08EDA9